jgi:MFS family permease
VLIWTIGEIVYAPVASAYVADIAPVHLRGRYQGAWGLMWGLAFMLGPGLGAVFFAWNGDAFWLFCGVLGALSAGLLLAGSSPPRSPSPAQTPDAQPSPSR